MTTTAPPRDPVLEPTLENARRIAAMPLPMRQRALLQIQRARKMANRLAQLEMLSPNPRLAAQHRSRAAEIEAFEAKIYQAVYEAQGRTA